MKIYRKIKIDIDTGEVLEEDSYEYDGPIAECGPGGNEPSVQYSQSPQQMAVWQALQPLVQNIGAQAGVSYPQQTYMPQPAYAPPAQQQVPGTPGYVGDDSQLPAAYQGGTYLSGINPISSYQPTATGSYPGLSLPTQTGGYAQPQSSQQAYGQPSQQSSGFLWNTPDVPLPMSPPSAQGIYSDVRQPNVSPYSLSGIYTGDVGRYGIPSVENLMPTQGWYGSIAPEVMAGLEEPYNRARSQMFETLGAGGLSGSARAGFSGAAGAALGEFEANKASQLGLQAWQMTQPALQAQYQAELGRGRDVWGAERQQDMSRDAAKLERSKYVGTTRDMLAQQAAAQLQQQNLMDYQSQMAYNQALQNAQMQQWAQQAEAVKFPYTALPGMLGGSYASPVVDQGGGGSYAGLGALGGGALAMGLGAPILGPVGLGAMALGGAFGGMF